MFVEPGLERCLFPTRVCWPVPESLQYAVYHWVSIKLSPTWYCMQASDDLVDSVYHFVEELQQSRRAFVVVPRRAPIQTPIPESVSDGIEIGYDEIQTHCPLQVVPCLFEVGVVRYLLEIGQV